MDVVSSLPHLVKRPFLVSQCKRESRQEDKASWNEAQHQLERYLPGMALRSGRPQGPHYGVVIIGKKVKFYKWNPLASQLEVWRGGIKYHIWDHAQIIHNRMMELRANH